MANETGALRLPPIDGIDAPHEVVPVEGWKLKGEHGHMAFDATKAGRLVSLAELVTWLMETSDLPCSMAVDAVCEKLGAPEATGWLYLVRPGVLARPLKADDCFAWWVVAYGDPGLNPEYHGITGAMCNMRSMWGASASPSECNYIGHENLDPLAIRMDKAHALWGWGTAVTDAVATPAPSAPVLALVPTEANNTEAPISEPSPWRKDRKAHAAEWTGERLTEKRKTLKGRDTTQQLAKLTGLPAREITRREKQARDDAAQALKAGNRASGMAA